MILPLIALMLFGTVEIGRLDATRYLTRIEAAALGLACPAVTVNNAAAEVINAKNLALRGSGRADRVTARKAAAKAP